MSRVTLTPKLEGVTVYNDSAQLTFTAEMAVDPSSVVVAVVENMERWGNVDWSTLQLRVNKETDQAVAAAVMLQNINPIHDTVTEDVREDVQRVKDEIKAIEEEQDMLQEEVDILQESCSHIDSIKQFVSSKAFKVSENGSEESKKYFQSYLKNAAGWSATGAFFASRKAEAERGMTKLRGDMEKVNERLQAATRRLMDLGGECGFRTHVRNSLEATLVIGEAVPAATKLRLEMSCVVSGAGWSPLYDLRVDYAASMLDVFYYANVRQCTSVDWEKVRLRLSTATPHTGGSPPPLWSRWDISLNPPAPQPRFYGRSVRMAHSKARSGGFGAAAPASAPMAPMVMQATVEGGGSSSSASVYTIPGLATVRHNNVEVKVTVAHERFPAKLQFVSMPKLEPLTHLSATAVNSTDYEFIAGPSKIFYGTTFVNQSQLGNVSPGEEFQVSLGTDETVTVNRTLVRRGESEKSSFFSNNKSQLDFHYAYAVECGALATEGPVTVVVKDNYPVSDDSDVVVALKEPVPTSGDVSSSLPGATVAVDEDTHEISWSFPMKKNEKRHFNMMFSAKYPEKTETFGLA